jgi:hypothetical protein
MKRIIVIGISALFIFSGCEKEDTCNLTQESLIGTYRLTALTYRESPGSPVEDDFSGLSECVKDNLFSFNSDRTFRYQDAGLVCSSNLDYTATWTLTGTTLEYGGDISIVSDFNCERMVTTISDVDVQGDVLTATFIKL